MIRIPTLSKQEIEDLKTLKHNEGYQIIVKSIEYTIKENNVTLANWDFKFYEDKDMDGKEEFKQKQTETILLKSFLNFINSCNQMAEGKKFSLNTNNDVYL